MASHVARLLRRPAIAAAAAVQSKLTAPAFLGLVGGAGGTASRAAGGFAAGGFLTSRVGAAVVSRTSPLDALSMLTARGISTTAVVLQATGSKGRTAAASELQVWPQLGTSSALLCATLSVCIRSERRQPSQCLTHIDGRLTRTFFKRQLETSTLHHFEAQTVLPFSLKNPATSV